MNFIHVFHAYKSLKTTLRLTVRRSEVKTPTWNRNSECQASRVLKAVWSTPWVIYRISRKFLFTFVKSFWDVLWHSDWYQSKALVTRNNFYCHKTFLERLVLIRETNKCPRIVSKNPFLEVNFGVRNSTISQRLTSGEIYVFDFSSKRIENTPNNVYIFWMGDARAFQRTFNHVYTTSVAFFRTFRLGNKI